MLIKFSHITRHTHVELPWLQISMSSSHLSTCKSTQHNFIGGAIYSEVEITFRWGGSRILDEPANFSTSWHPSGEGVYCVWKGGSIAWRMPAVGGGAPIRYDRRRRTSNYTRGREMKQLEISWSVGITWSAVAWPAVARQTLLDTQAGDVSHDSYIARWTATVVSRESWTAHCKEYTIQYRFMAPLPLYP